MNVFRQEGEYWTVEYQGAVLRLRDVKGMQYLAYLLHHPGGRFTALELSRLVAGSAGNGGPRDTDHEAERARSAVGKRLRAAVQKIHDHHASLGRYLTVSVRTGRVCSYLPDPREPVTWAE